MAMPELLPLYDLIAKCNRCGFCQAGCPVYRVTGAERSLARGHWAVARGLILGEIELTPEAMHALDDCLLCRGCTAHCFPALKTDEVVTAIRQTYVARYGQSALQRTLFRRVLSDSKRLERAGRLAVWAKRSGLAALADKVGLLNLVDKRLGVANRVVESMPEKIFRRTAQNGGPAPAQPKHRVGYFASCGFSFQYPEVAEATLRVLKRNGCAVTILENTCCGRPAHAYGDIEAALAIARRNIDRLGPALELDAIVSECGSCSTHLKDYGRLLQDDPAYAPRAALLARKAQSFSEFLMHIGLQGDLAKLERTVTYHDPCHLSNRFAKITTQPRQLLRSIPGLAYRELPEADWCCGAAGTYTFRRHAEAVGVLERKMGNVERTGATIVATECPACMMHLTYGARRRGLSVAVRHVSQLLDQAYRGTPTAERVA